MGKRARRTDGIAAVRQAGSRPGAHAERDGKRAAPVNQQRRGNGQEQEARAAGDAAGRDDTVRQRAAERLHARHQRHRTEHDQQAAGLVVVELTHQMARRAGQQHAVRDVDDQDEACTAAAPSTAP
ncbi:hypothetical protein GCM10023335_88750 [Streptomyces siamensis]|uniref:Uncharacterized protein n=1 Tax=Streptomyces siamensis TaxID=1274986 RepID=A0ABP9JRA9_9ACTN